MALSFIIDNTNSVLRKLKYMDTNGMKINQLRKSLNNQKSKHKANEKLRETNNIKINNKIVWQS